MLQTIKISNNKEAVEEWISDFEDYIGYVKTYLFIELFDNEQIFKRDRTKFVLSLSKLGGKI